jgi:RHS repeat-associated protein
VRDGLGLEQEAINPDGAQVRYERNLLGWPIRLTEQRNSRATNEFDVSKLSYNGRGQLTRLEDPAGHVATMEYNPFGAVELWVLPGQPKAAVSLAYDNLGRLHEKQKGPFLIRYGYDSRGDQVSETLVDGSTLHPVTARAYDDLGRVVTSWSFNPTLSWVPQSARTVRRSLTYDQLERVQRDEVRVGSQPAVPVTSTWSILPGDVWERKIEYPLGPRLGEWWETFDLAGRLSQKKRRGSGPSGLSTSFQWAGNDILLGRIQAQEGHSSPFRQQREVDKFGRLLAWRYSAIDLDPSGQPIHPGDAATYCGGAWIGSNCGRQLLETRMLRDRMSRIVSLSSAFNHPTMSPTGIISSTHPAPWRGFVYDIMGRLRRLWEHGGTGTRITADGLRTHLVKPSDIEALASSAAAWDYDRELEVGGTKTIHRSLGTSIRWALGLPRGPGHQLQEVTIDGSTRILDHDQSGNVQRDGSRTYLFDPHNRLAAVTQTGGAVLEAYLYDAGGRLAAVLPGSALVPSIIFALDGHQMVAAYNAQGQPQWEAAWGPAIDQLLEWRDYAGSRDHIPLSDYRNSVVATWMPAAARLSGSVDYSVEGRATVRDLADQQLCQEEGSGTVCSLLPGFPFGFSGAWRSLTTGLTYLRNRWYSPELGQFLSHDPLGFAESFNLYSFGGFDPVNLTDPFGLQFGRPSHIPPAKAGGLLWKYCRFHSTAGVTGTGEATSYAGVRAGLKNLNKTISGVSA